MQTPKLSIITVNLNNAEGLKKTIESVVSQTFTDYEYIIIDGGSTDGSKEIIEKYADKITYWVSEPDKGIYNGMNKGIKAAKGEYCQFLNSGDWLISNPVLEEVFVDFPDKDIVYGNLKTQKRVIYYPEKLTLSVFFFGSIGHPASFIRKSLFEQYGYYNEKHKIVSDWEFFINTIIVNNRSYYYIKSTISFFDLSGISSDENFYTTRIKERETVLKKYFPLMYDDYIDFKNTQTELLNYKNSRLFSFFKTLQSSQLYKFFKP